MKLSDVDIRNYLDEGRLVVDPLVPEHIGPISIDLSLDGRFLFFKHSQLTLINVRERTLKEELREADLMDEIDVGADGRFILQPGQFALGSTVERVALPADLAGWLDGRSSLARVGLMVHATAHTLEPGWDGAITLEFFNAGNVALALYPGVRICAVSFEKLTTPVERNYAAKGGRYQGQRGPVASRLTRD
jgi:dCTP deaminase